MGKVKGKHRLDKYYWLAKEHGYRSRAAWKLVQIDSKFNLLRSSRSVLDLCAAPGGWLQAAIERVPFGSLVLGIDLVPIAPIKGAVTFEGDITRTECKSMIKKLMAEHGVRAFDLVVHDGSPNVGGAWSQEATVQNALVVDSIRLASQYLAPKGNFVTKIFRSQDYNSVLFCLNKLFDKVEVWKPAASRDSSAETYFVALKYKAPAKIDPHLLDVKYLFAPVEESKKVADVLRGTKQKRHRDGYEDGESIVRKVCSAADFIWTDKPMEILGSVTSISFAEDKESEDPARSSIKDHPLTTEEVKSLCEDLGVLGRQDFRRLIKWRLLIRKALTPKREIEPTPSDVANDTKVDEEERLLNEMEELTYATEHKKKREKKLLAKRLAKEKTRKATGMQVDAMEDGYTDHELFSLSSIKDKKDLVAVDASEYDDENGDMAESGSEENVEEPDSDTATDIDSDEERERYNGKMEALLDQAYEQFMSKKAGSTKQRKRAKKAYDEDDQILEGGDGDDIAPQSDNDSDNVVEDGESNPLMVPLHEREVPTQDEITERWFSQDIFAEAVKDTDLGNDDSDDEMQVDEQDKKPSLQKKAEKNPVLKKETLDRKKPSGIKAQQGKGAITPKADDDFEIVPAPTTDSSDSSSSEESDLDDEAKAEILATGRKMLRKKQRELMLDDAYNRYMFHDDKGLPKWFLEDEQKHRQPIKPVTKEEVNAMKAQFREIDARPAKKVAEAKARKKRVAMRKLEKVRKKANTISDQADISDRSKNKMIDQLYKKATPKRPEREYVVAKKGVQVKTGKGKVLVDRRMKKDARSQGMKKKQGKGKKAKNMKGGKGQGSNNSSAFKGKGGSKGRRT